MNPSRVTKLGDDAYDGCEAEGGCPSEATHRIESEHGTYRLMCERHAREVVSREAFELIAYPGNHPAQTKPSNASFGAQARAAFEFHTWATSVAANALSFGAVSYQPWPSVQT